MNINDLIHLHSNPQPIPSSFNEGFSQYETIKYLIGVVNNLINDMNFGSDEIVDLQQKKVDLVKHLEDIAKLQNDKLDKNGDFTGTINGLPIQSSDVGLATDINNAKGTFASLTARLQSFSNLIYSGQINVMYPPLGYVGAKGDKATDDYSSIQALAYAFPKARFYFPQGVYRISQPIIFGVLQDGTPTQSVRIEGENKNTVIYLDFSGAYANRAGFEIGKQTNYSNIGHSVKHLKFSNSQTTPSSCFGLRVYNPYGFVTDDIDFRTYNSLDIMRNGSYGYTAINTSINNSTLYAGYYSNDGVNDIPEATPQGRYSVHNSGLNKWDDVTFNNCKFNSYCEMMGTRVTINGGQAYNEKKVSFVYTDSGYSDMTTCCIWFKEGTLIVNQTNFEVYQNAIAFGSYNKIVENCQINNANFNGVAYASNQDFSANALVFMSGGTGYVRAVKIKNSTFLYNQKSDAIIDNTANNGNGIPYVSGVEFEDCKTLDSPFSTYHNTISSIANTSTTTTLTNTAGVFLKQFYGQNAKIVINGVAYTINAFPNGTDIIIDGVIAVSNATYSRQMDIISRKGFIGTINPGQFRNKFTGTTPITGNSLQGDELTIVNPVAGGYKGQVCVAPNTWKGYGLIQA